MFRLPSSGSFISPAASSSGDRKMEQPIKSCHVVAMPYPGRGHINPMMNFCKQLASKKDDILITFVLTEEWLGFLRSDAKPPPQIRFATIPNVIPSEIGRGADLVGFFEAVMTKLEEPFEQLLDHLEPPRPTVIIYDAFIGWVVGVGNRRNIPVAPFWTQSSSVLTVFLHFHLLQQNGHFPADVSLRGNELVEYIPGLPPTRLADLPTIYYGVLNKCLHRVLEAISMLPKAQYLLLTSTYELESDIIDALKATVPIPIYSIGPAIPNFTINSDANVINDATSQWLDAQPKSSVLYISQGSFLSVSSAQMDEIIAGVNSSGIRFLWVAGGAVSQIKDRCGGGGSGGGGGCGIVVRWSDQLKVLCHPAVGGFWSHCGWSSTKEGVYAGLPFLTYPIIWDQIPNSKAIVEDWKTGWKVMKGTADEESLVTREEIAGILQRFMDSGDEEVKEMRTRAKKLHEICRQATSKGGSVEANIDAFIQEISK